MSIFAAYADANEQNAESVSTNQTEWLINSSYTINTSAFISTSELEPLKNALEHDESDTRSNSSCEHRKRRKEKKRKSTKRYKTDIPSAEKTNFDFFIDCKRTPEYFSVNTIHRPSVPKYRIKNHIRDGFFISKSCRKKLPRYFHFKVEKTASDDEVLTKSDLLKPVEKQNDAAYAGYQHEEDITKMTGFYNKSLGEDPMNIEMWIKYADFQDTVFQFEKTYRKGSVAKGLRVTATRKLSILDKALTHNPDSERLLRLRLNIAVNAYPADELKEQLRKLVDKEKGNIILWQGYIEATQCSMSHCNTPAVLYLYIHCLETLHTLRRTSKLEKAQLEENILRILYQCGLFLRQAGLFEQLYTLLCNYLELNAAAKFNLPPLHNEEKLVELEEVVLNSQLPRHEIWLRVEKLREATHFLPHNKSWSDEAERIFFSDVRNLIHPITIPENIFKLTVMMLTLIKIPLLPCRHTIMQEFGIDYVPWALDSVETLFSVFLPILPIELNNVSLVQNMQKLVVGPQYLKMFPGQEEYLQFVLGILKGSIDSLTGREKSAITIWWFRFQRLLIILERQQLFKFPGKLKDLLKSQVKNVLQNDPTNVNLFREYALLEHEFGRTPKAIMVLKTALAVCENHNLVDLNERAGLCATFRTLIELYLHEPSKNRTECLKYFANFVSCYDINASFDLDNLDEIGSKFQRTTNALLQAFGPEKLSGLEHFLPNFITEWIICNGWFLYLHNSTSACLNFMEQVLNKLDDINNEKSLIKEVFLEFMVGVVFKECIETPGSGLFGKLDQILMRALKEYPNNLFSLAVVAKVQSMHNCHGQPWWKIKTILLKSGHVLPSLFLVLIANERITAIEKGQIDSITGSEIVHDNAFKNSMLSLFKKLTSGVLCTRRCGLLWRLYLQFLHTYFDPQMCRNAYYVAVEECPWLKALYIDAAIYVPEDLHKIQDLITEKQFRIHIHPQELEVFLDEQI